MNPTFFWKITTSDKQEFLVGHKPYDWVKNLEASLKLLPFKELESFDDLPNSDFYFFVKDLYSLEETIIIEKSGKVFEGKMPIHKQIFLQKIPNIFEFYEKEFEEKIKSRNSRNNGKPIKIDNNVRKKFYKTLKYIAAWDTLEQWILEESRFHSLVLVLDTYKEIEASFLLVKNFYYKQAMQMLRNFIELVVAQYYFSLETSIYEDWRTKKDYKMPRFTGDNGMLKKLALKNKISANEKNQLENLFQKLSAYTHSRYEKLIHINPNSQEIRHFDYNPDYFLEWMELLDETTAYGLMIMYRCIRDWQNEIGKSGDLLCPKCHNNGFKEINENWGKTKVKLHICKNCNNSLRTIPK